MATLTTIPSGATLNSNGNITDASGQIIGTSSQPYSLGNTSSNNAGFATTPSLTGNNSGLTGSSADAGNNLNSSLNTAFNNSQDSQTIMQAYQAQIAADQAAQQTTATKISDEANQNIENQQYQGALNTQSAITASKGLVNPGAMTVIQNQSNTIIKQLTQTMNDALANNNASLYTATANALATEQSNMITARQNFLSNYFSTQQEARAESSFQTPEQAQVLTLAGQYPNAGIATADTLAQAQAKVTASAQYKLTQASTQSTIGLQGAQAGLASTQAQQESIINKFMSGDTAQFSGDVSGLVSGSTTDATLHAKYDNFPGGAGTAIIASIESQAQAQGWSPETSLLSSNAKNSQNEALNSGNPFTLLGAGLTQGIGAVTSPLSGAGSVLNNTLSGMKAPAVGATGTLYNGTKVTYNANGTITDVAGNQYDSNGNLTKSAYFK